MNKEEFKELQNETAFYIYNIELRSKEYFLTDIKYNYYFFDLLKEKIAVENEINFIKGMIDNKNRNLNCEEFKKAFVKQVKDNNSTIEAKHSNVLMTFDAITSVVDDKRKELENYFHDFIREHHPVVTYNKSKDAAMAFDFVKKMYRENNYSGMVEAYNLNKASLQTDIIGPSQYNEVALLHYEFKKQITAGIMKVKETDYPRNKMEVVKSEENILKEKEQIKKDTEELLKALSALESDYENLFGQKPVYEFE